MTNPKQERLQEITPDSSLPVPSSSLREGLITEMDDAALIAEGGNPNNPAARRFIARVLREAALALQAATQQNERLVNQAVDISQMLAAAGEGPCTNVEAVRSVIRRAEAAESALQAAEQRIATLETSHSAEGTHACTCNSYPHRPNCGLDWRLQTLRDQLSASAARDQQVSGLIEQMCQHVRSHGVSWNPDGASDHEGHPIHLWDPDGEPMSDHPWIHGQVLMRKACAVTVAAYADRISALLKTGPETPASPTKGTT